MPPLQLNDEHGHFLRAYRISDGEWISHSKAIPPALVVFLQRYPESIEMHRKVIPSELMAELSGPAAAPAVPPAMGDDASHRYLTWGILGSSLYCPIVYLPASAGITLARVLRLAPLGMLYMARTFNVLTLLVAVWLAFRLAPSARTLVAAVALMPMTLNEAGGLSADAVTIAISLIGFALIIRTREGLVSGRLLAATGATFTVWALAKACIWAMPLLLLIPEAAFRTRRRRVSFVAGTSLAMLVALVAWQITIHANMEAFQTARMARGIDASANLAFLLAHPIAYARMLAVLVGGHTQEYFYGFIGTFGWTQFRLAWWTYPLYGALLFLAVRSSAPGRPISASERMLFGLVFLVAAAVIHILLFVSDGVVNGGSSAGVIAFPASAGVQGRYFIPFCLAGLLALRPYRNRISRQTAQAIVLCTAGAFDLLCLYVFRLNYYL